MNQTQKRKSKTNKGKRSQIKEKTVFIPKKPLRQIIQDNIQNKIPNGTTFFDTTDNKLKIKIGETTLLIEDHKRIATELGELLFSDINKFREILNNYEVLGTIEIIKAKFTHDLSKIADAKQLLNKEGGQ